MNFNNLDDLFSYFENESDPFYLSSVETALQKVDETEENKFELKAERLALGFYPNLHNSNNWGTYFGPKMSGQDKDGQWFETPNIKFVTEEIIKYWIKRADESRHPVLKIRYNDLIWDLTEITTGDKPNYKHAKQAILSTIKLIKKSVYKNINIVLDKLDRALNLSLSLNNLELQQEIKDVYFELFEDEKENHPHLFNHLYTKLIQENNSIISGKEEEYIIDELEIHLENKLKEEDLFEVEKTSLNLAHYYRAIDKHQESKRVLKKYEKVIELTAVHDSPLIVSSNYKKLYDIYTRYGFNEEADNISSNLHEAGEKSIQSMGKFEHEFEIKEEEIKEFVDSILSGEIEEIIVKLISNFIPNKNQTEKLVQELAQKAPLEALISQTLQDKEGRIIAEIGSVEEDLEGRTIRQLAQNLSFEAYFLRKVLSTFFEINDVTDQLYNILNNSPVFNGETLKLLKEGMDRYFENDFVSSIHIFVPLVEKCLRNLLEINGGTIYRPGKNGGIFLRNLDEILRDPIITQTLNENIIFYYKALLSDQRSWNLRNKVSHGILDYSEFTIEKADRLFHALLIFSQVKYKSK